jgi:hypothetical protein
MVQIAVQQMARCQTGGNLYREETPLDRKNGRVLYQYLLTSDLLIISRKVHESILPLISDIVITFH